MDIKLDNKISTVSEYFIKDWKGMWWQVGVRKYIPKEAFLWSKMWKVEISVEEIYRGNWMCKGPVSAKHYSK